MGTHADFKVLHIFKCFGDENDCFGKPGFAFAGAAMNEFFTIAGVPAGHEPGEAEVKGYLLINTFDVNDQNHQIEINGIDLPGTELMPHPERKIWQTRMVVFTQKDVNLRQGQNKLTIRLGKGSQDNFLIGDVIIHWRERD